MKHLASLALLGLIPLCACSSSDSDDDSGGTTAPPAQSVSNILPAVQILETGQVANFVPGLPPAGQGSPVSISTAGSNTAITGGTSQVTLTPNTALDEITVRVGGVDGYWQLPVTTLLPDYTLLLTLADNFPLPAGTFECIYGASAGGVAADEVTDTVEVISAGTGDVRVTLSWNGTSDLDLYVTDPFGEEIAFFNPFSASGGQLDVDSNVGCIPDGSVENIFWPTGSAPSGLYSVSVDSFEACEVNVPYTVTVEALGSSSVFVGSFVNGAPTPQLVTEFVVN
ncbi:MAG: hypothetical protein ACYS26_08610 [Planctomycetota bacterium]|jgi:hypothetical protein